MERSSRRKKRSASTSPVPPDATKKPKQPVIIAVSKDPPDDPTQAFVPLDRDIMYHYLDLPPADADHVPPPEPLKQSERLELQAILEFADQDEWHSDWSGNLTFMDKLISNPTKRKKSSSFQQSLLQWATNVQQPRYLYNLLRMIYHLPNTPHAAKTILASASATDVTSLEQAMRRVSYDPVVLRQDGWTTMRSEDHPSATGGPYYIGAKIRWQDSDAVVIAYVHDADIGDLWKAYWIHEQQCFDLEYEEVLEAKRKWERRNQQQQQQQQNQQQQQSRKSSRFAGSHDFSVPGIEHGIVLAASFAKGARPGVYWPARVVHASEHSALAVATTSKRSSAKQKVDLMFLAPYWNSDARQKSNSLSEAGSSFSAGPLFHLENVDATDEMIKEYTFGNSEADGQQLDLDELRMSFRFTGLPKPAFQRFLDSHRLALALKTYAQHHLKAEDFANAATAGLFETHIMSVQAPLFPSVVLHLPFDFILEQLRNDKEPSRKSGTMQDKEPALQLSSIVESMKRPNCWGLSGGVVNGVVRSPMASTPIKAVPLMDAGKAEDDEKKTSVNGEVNALFESMTDDLALLQKTLSRPSTDLACLRKNIGQIIASLVNASSAKEDSQRDAAARRQRLIQSWVIMKRTGADILSVNSNKCKVVLREWNVASERIYRYVVAQTTNELEGNGKSLVLSDYRCNGHRTSGGCFERAVRLPAAMKGAKLAGAGKSPSIGLVTEVGSKEMERAEREIIPRAHTKSYVERMKTRCAAAKANEESVMLTDDSQGNGGQDTSKFLSCRQQVFLLKKGVSQTVVPQEVQKEHGMPQ